MADISPELAAKIQDLEVRYEENPGRVFVALASAYREAGETGRAEDLLRTGLKRHPGSLSAHVLLGRCLADRGASEEANNEFRYVLSVDPQNLIALRTLGEMAASTGQTDEAARWYRELLAVDPMNKEAKDALDALALAPAPAPRAEAPQVTDFGMVDLELTAPEPTPAAPTDHAEFGLAEPVGFGFEIAPAGEPEPASHEPAAGGTVAEFGMVELDTAFSADESAGGEPTSASADAFGGWGEISLEPEAAGAPQGPAGEVGSEPAEEFGAFAFGGIEPGAPAGPPEETPGEAGGLEVLEAVSFQGFGEAEPAGDAAHDEDGEMVTETMAELYARQGFHDRAAEVYRELVRLRGEEPALLARLAEMERQAREGGGEAPAAIEPWAPAPGEYGEVASFEVAPDGEEALAAAGEALPLLETGLPGLDLPISAGAPAYEPETADAFADSFAHGFAGAGYGEGEEPALAVVASPAEEAAAEPPFVSAEDVTPIADQPYGADSLGGEHADEPVPLYGGVEPSAGPEAEETTFVAVPAHDMEEPDHEEAFGAAAASPPPPAALSTYLASLLAWRPGAVMPADESPAEAAPLGEAAEAPAGDEAAAPHDTAAEEEVPAAEWEMPAPPVEVREEEPAAPGADEDLPWIEAVAPAEESPAADAEESAPWEAAPWGAPAEPAAGELGGFQIEDTPVGDHVREIETGPRPVAEDALYPWEFATEPPAAAEAGPAAAPAAEPEAAEASAGGFSFEDFFSRPASEQEPAPPAAAPAPAPQQPAAGTPAGGEGEGEDEDLESFQAWLQSLKR